LLRFVSSKESPTVHQAGATGKPPLRVADARRIAFMPGDLSGPFSD
jgi:hypothetical protein